MLSRKNNEKLMDFAKVATTSYSQGDEEEADAIAVAISRRAGYNPLRGADFFSRNKLQQETTQKENQQLLAKKKHEVQQAQAMCFQETQKYNSSWLYHSRERANRVNAICHDAESKRLTYNQVINEYAVASVKEQRDSFFRTHPQDQNRIAAIAVLTDYVYGRRDISSVTKYEQSYHVMLALRQVDSVLLKPPALPAVKADVTKDSSPETASNTNLVDQLAELKQAHGQGLLTDIEYERKREQILNRY